MTVSPVANFRAPDKCVVEAEGTLKPKCLPGAFTTSQVNQAAWDCRPQYLLHPFTGSGFQSFMDEIYNF